MRSTECWFTPVDQPPVLNRGCLGSGGGGNVFIGLALLTSWGVGSGVSRWSLAEPALIIARLIESQLISHVLSPIQSQLTQRIARL